MMQTLYILKFQCNYNNQPLTNLTFRTFSSQPTISANFLQNSISHYQNLKIHRLEQNYVMESGDHLCGNGFCTKNNMSTSAYIQDFKFALAAIGLEGQIGNGFYVQLGDEIINGGTIFGVLEDGDQVRQKLGKVVVQGDEIIGDLRMKFLWYEEV